MFGHANWKTVLNALRTRFQWDNMRQDVWSQLQTCDQCCKFNSPSVKVGAPMLPIITTKPLEILHMDFIHMPKTCRGNRYIIAAIDHFSRFVFLRPTRRKNMWTAIRFLRELFQQTGKFSEIIVDRDPAFMARGFQQFLADENIQFHPIDKTHFEANGSIERFVRSLKSIQAKAFPQIHRWDLDLHRMVYKYNIRTHSATNASPMELFWPEHHTLPMDIKYNLHPQPSCIPGDVLRHQAAYIQRVKRIFDRGRQQLEVGDLVASVIHRPAMAKHDCDRHLQPRREQPFRILEILPLNKYKLTDGSRTCIRSGFQLHKLPAHTPFPKGGRMRETNMLKVVE